MLTPQQFEGWMHYAEIEPFGLEADDFRAAVLNSTIAAVAGAKGFDPQAFMLSTFLAGTAAPAEESSVEAKLDAVFGITNPPTDNDEAKLDRLLGVH